MATFESLELSAESGSKIELYTLAIGSTIYRMHTSVEPILNYAGFDYLRVQIGRGAISTGQEFLEVTLPGSHPFPLNFTSIAPGQVASLLIQAVHRDEPTDVKVIYKGVVRSVAFTQNASMSALSLVPINAALDKEIPERTYQAPCNNVLFDADCKIVKASWKYDGTVSAVAGNEVTVTGLEAAKGDGWSTGGYASFGVLDYRLITTQDGDDLILPLPFYESVLNETVTVYAGCNHDIGVCASKFSNEINFGGFPYVPTKNIFITGV